MAFSYAGGILTAANEAGISITAAASVTGGVRFTATNSFAVGDPVTITGTTNYNGNWIVSAATGTTFDVIDQVFIDRTSLAYVSSQSGTVARGTLTSSLNGLTGVTRTGTAGRYVYTLAGVRIVVTGFWLLNPDIEMVQFDDTCTFPLIDNQGDFQVGIRRIVNSKTLYSNGTAIVCTKTPTSVPQTQPSGLMCSTTGSPRHYWYGGEIRSTCSVSIGGYLNNASQLTRLNGDVNVENGTVVNLNGSLANGSYYGIQYRPGDMNANRNCRVTGLTLDSATDANTAAPTILFSSTFNLFSCTFKKGRFQQFAVPSGDLEASNLVFANNGASYDYGFNGNNAQQDYVLAVKNTDNGAGIVARSVTIQAGVRGLQEVRQDVTLTVRNSAGTLISDGVSYAKVTPSTAITPYLRGDLNYTNAREYIIVPSAGLGSFTALMAVAQAPGSGTTLTTSAWDETQNFSDTLYVDHWYYNYQYFRDTLTARGNGGTAVTPRLLTDSNISQTTRATVQAYTTIETLDKLYDRAKDWKCTNTSANINYPSRTTQPITASGATLDLGSRNLIIDATAGSAFAVNTGTNTITIKASTLSAGSKFNKITTTGTITFSNGATAGNDLIYTQNGVTSAVATLSGLISGAKYQLRKVSDDSLVGEGTASGTTAIVRYTHTTDFAVNCYAGKYGYKRATTSTTLSASGGNATFTLISEPFVVADEATASAYTGITESYTGLTCTLSTTHTLQEIFDYLNYTNSTLTNLRYAPLISTVNGTDFSGTFAFTINTGISLNGSGLLDIGAKTLTLTGTATYADTMRIKHSAGTNKTIILSGTANNRNYRIEKQGDQSMVYEGTATGTSVSIKHLYTSSLPVKLITGQYGYNRFSSLFTIDDQIQTVVVLNTTDSFVVADQTTALAYPFTYSTNVFTATADISALAVQKMYDFSRATFSGLTYLTYDEPMSTTDGNAYLFNGSYSFATGNFKIIDVENSLASIATKVNLGTSGLFEDSQSVQWKYSGSTYYASHWYGNVKDAGTNNNIQSASIGFFDIATSTKLLYLTTGLTAPVIASTDVSGNADAYLVWKKDSTVYAQTKMIIGEYNYQFSTIPRTLGGLPIGSTSSREVSRLNPDLEVVKTKANALLVAGITVSTSTKTVDLSSNTHQDAYDNLKARMSGTTEIETGVFGILAYAIYGLLITEANGTYTGISDWIYQNFGTGATWTNGIIEWSTPATISKPFAELTFNFLTAGTYDFRGSDISGTLTLDTTNNSSVTVKVKPGTTVVNNKPLYITVEYTLAVSVQVNNVISGSRIQVYNTSDSVELYNEIVSGTTFTKTYTYTVDKNIRVRLMYVNGTSAYQWYELTGTITSSGFSANASQVINSVYNANGIDGSTVTECSISPNGIDIYVDDPDNTTTAQRIYNWYQYYLSTSTGIGVSHNYIEATDSTHYVFDNTIQIRNLDTANPLNITGANIVPESGMATDIFDLSNGASIALNFNRVEYATGAGDPWTTNLSTYNTANTAGKILKDTLIRADDASL